MVEEPETHRVINLMDALRASIGADAKKPAAASTGTRRTHQEEIGAGLAPVALSGEGAGRGASIRLPVLNL